MQAAKLEGQKFGRLTVIKRVGSKNGQAQWECRCDCGNIKFITTAILKCGGTKSCGCYSKDCHTKHGDHKERLYRIWCGMNGRCNHVSNTNFKYYGAKGIKICKEWEDYKTFKAWAIQNGYKDDLSLDRINNSENYEPGNCRWVTMKEQQNHKTNNHKLTYNGEEKTISEWAEITGIKTATLFTRIKRGWSTERALTTQTGGGHH